MAADFTVYLQSCDLFEVPLSAPPLPEMGQSITLWAHLLRKVQNGLEEVELLSGSRSRQLTTRDSRLKPLRSHAIREVSDKTGVLLGASMKAPQIVVIEITVSARRCRYC